MLVRVEGGVGGTGNRNRKGEIEREYLIYMMDVCLRLLVGVSVLDQKSSLDTKGLEDFIDSLEELILHGNTDNPPSR